MPKFDRSLSHMPRPGPLSYLEIDSTQKSVEITSSWLIMTHKLRASYFIRMQFHLKYMKASSSFNDSIEIWTSPIFSLLHSTSKHIKIKAVRSEDNLRLLGINDLLINWE